MSDPYKSPGFPELGREIDAHKKEVAERLRKEQERIEHQRRNLLARMAGNIAAGLVNNLRDPDLREHQWEEEIAHDAVAIARAILAELEGGS